jgi:D-amino-acid dehydrogenase
VTTVVLGAGVIGVTTAYFLARGGEKATVVDRQPGAGLETSFANGALVTPGMSDPWAAPGIPGLILKHLGREDAPFLLRLHALPGMLGWGLRFLRNCAPARWWENTERVLRLAVHSRDVLDAVTRDTGIAYDRGERGNLRVYPDAASLAKAAEMARLYRELGEPVHVLDAAACIALEPALAPIKHELAGAVHYAGDRSGDCLKFTQSLATEAAKLGVAFDYGTTVLGFETDGNSVTAVRTNKGRVQGQRFVLACGSYSPLLARKIAVTRLGDRIRLAGTAEFGGYDTSPNPARAAMLLQAFGTLFPEYPKGGTVEHWQGLRPMTPDGRPILGATRYANLYLNTGHGPLGWTLACGSARALVDLISGRRPEVDLAPFSLDRF